MTRVLLALVLALTAGCSVAPARDALPTLRDPTGTWRGRLAVPAANAATSLTINQDGSYAGTMHLERGDRPFTGAIVITAQGRLRYHGTFGDGSVQANPANGAATALRFVPDGGGGGSFTRVQ